jgi:hypothetical protein
VFEGKFRGHGLHQGSRQLERMDHDLARSAVASLMRGLGLEGVSRSRQASTAICDRAATCPLDQANRSGFAYVAFIYRSLCGADRAYGGWLRWNRPARTAPGMATLE